MFLVLIIWFQPIKHVLACWSSPFSCYKILFWWSGNWHRLETPFLLQWWLEVWTNYMIQDYWIHVPNHQWLFTFPTLLMTQWKIHIYIYACYIVFLWLKWLGISSPSEVITIINTVLRNWGLRNLVYLVFRKCLWWRWFTALGLLHYSLLDLPWFATIITMVLYPSYPLWIMLIGDIHQPKYCKSPNVNVEVQFQLSAYNIFI